MSDSPQNHLVESVTATDIVHGFERLGILGKSVEVHASLRSFGHVCGGVDSVVEALLGSFANVLSPAFGFDSVAPPPPGDFPDCNGCDIAYYQSRQWPVTPFVPETARVDERMGILNRALCARPGARRSGHPWHSWAAHGKSAGWLTQDHSWLSANQPLERLADQDGWIVLLGVGISSCTAVHVAEEWAGRRPFIRWAWDHAGVTRRIHVGGCARGFDRLWPSCAALWRETHVGKCCVRAAPLRPFLVQLAAVIREQPALTCCSPSCIRCRDAVLGGPPAAAEPTPFRLGKWFTALTRWASRRTIPGK